MVEMLCHPEFPKCSATRESCKCHTNNDVISKPARILLCEKLFQFLCSFTFPFVQKRENLVNEHFRPRKKVSLCHNGMRQSSQSPALQIVTGMGGEIERKVVEKWFHGAKAASKLLIAFFKCN